MIKTGRFWVFISILFCFYASAQQGTVVTSTVDRNKLEVQDTFTLTVTVQSTESVEIEEPRLPPLSGLDLVQNWDNTAVQQSLVQTPQGMDFKTIRKREFHYMFQTKTPGRYSLDAFEVSVNGKLFQTEPIIVEVFPSGQAPQGSNRSRGRNSPAPDEDPEETFLRQQEEVFNQLLQRQFGGGLGGSIPQIPQLGNRPGRSQQEEPQFRSMPQSPNDAFFIQLEVDKTSVYEGEQVTATWYLLTRGQVETLDRAKFPALRGFWKEIIEENPQIQFSEEIINGIPYRKALLASHALFPIKAGRSIIDEFTLKSRVRMPSPHSGFGRSFEYSKSSKRVEIEVKPLPIGANRPASFTGAVGQYSVASQVEGTQFPLNQPFSFKLRFEGQGNAKAIELPAIDWPAGLEVYDTKNESRFFKDGNSFKEFEVLLIPRKEGILEIPGVSFSFFNPKTNKYEQKQTESIKLTILSGAAVPGSNNSNSFLGNSDKNVPNSIPKTLPGLIESSVLANQKNSLNFIFAIGNRSAQVPTIWSFWGLLMGLLTVGLGIFGFQELKTGSRAISVRRLLDLQWKKVELAFSQNQPKQVGIEIVNAFNLVLSEVSHYKAETQEIHKMLEKMDPEIRSKLGLSLLASYEEAQLLGFAPDSAVVQLSKKDNLKSLIKKSKDILNQVCD